MRTQIGLLLLTLCLAVYCDKNCPAGYSNRDYVHCYKIYNDTVARQVAESHCEKEGGYLAAIANGFDNSYISSLAQQAGVSSIWLGTKCSNANKLNCTNDDGTMSGPYYNFYPGNPSTIGNCLYMSTKGNTASQWVSANCTTNMLAYVCQFAYGSGCQPGYTLYLGSCYRAGVATSSANAEESCEDECGHLTSIHSDKENSIVLSSALSLNISSSFVRIGLMSTVTPNTSPAWLDGSDVDYNNIDFLNTNVGLCFAMAMDNRLIALGNWSSVNCDRSMPYVCKTAPGVCITKLPTEAPPTCSKQAQSYSGTGTIYSPGYRSSPGYNPNPCKYLITSQPGTVVEIDFTELTLTWDTAINLYDDITDPLAFAVLNPGNDLNASRIFRSSENQMLMVFTNPGNSPDTIWKLNYKPTSDPDLRCPSDYHMYNNVCYKFETSKMTRSAAAASCKKYPGGNLVTVPTRDMDFYLLQLEQYTIQTEDSNAYIGLTCPHVKTNGDSSSCVWDDGTPTTYIPPFYSGSPSANPNATCVDFNGGDFASVSCDQLYYSICQAAAGPY